jgi:hypothetical protein
MSRSLFYAHAPHDTGITYQKLDLVNDQTAGAGNLVWGVGPTNSLLFACVESLAEDSLATNKYFDVHTGYSSAFTRPGFDSNVIAMSNQGSFQLGVL